MKKLTLLTALCLTLSANAAQTCNSSIAASTPDSRFTTTADTVTDTQTGLIWMRCSLGLSGSDCSTGSAGTYTWEAALQAPAVANTANTAGHNDWRLPNIKELASIVETRCYDPAINTTIFPNTPSSGYWSSSPDAGYNSRAWGVLFDNGFDNNNDKSNSRYVRLVRGSSDH